MSTMELRSATRSRQALVQQRANIASMRGTGRDVSMRGSGREPTTTTSTSTSTSTSCIEEFSLASRRRLLCRFVFLDARHP
eukprot:7205855-Prymnesium_polylepis.3